MATTAISAIGILDSSSDSRDVIRAASFAAIKNLLDIDDLEVAVTAIQSLLASDETTLDSLQEVVDFIELNRADLGTLSITSIAGLQAALDTAVNLTGNQLIAGEKTFTSLTTFDDTIIVYGSADFSNASSVIGLTKSNVGLDFVDNTSDLDKPISTLVQAALDLKEPVTDFDVVYPIELDSGALYEGGTTSTGWRINRFIDGIKTTTTSGAADIDSAWNIKTTLVYS